MLIPEEKDFLEKRIQWWKNLVENHLKKQEEYKKEDWLDDYLNDLDIRMSIEKAINSTPENLKKELKSILDPIDNDFKKVTKLDEKNLIPGFKKEDGWWYERVPISWN